MGFTESDLFEFYPPSAIETMENRLMDWIRFDKLSTWYFQPTAIYTGSSKETALNTLYWINKPWTSESCNKIQKIKLSQTKELAKSIKPFRYSYTNVSIYFVSYTTTFGSTTLTIISQTIFLLCIWFIYNLPHQEM